MDSADRVLCSSQALIETAALVLMLVFRARKTSRFTRGLVLQGVRVEYRYWRNLPIDGPPAHCPPGLKIRIVQNWYEEFRDREQ